MRIMWEDEVHLQSGTCAHPKLFPGGSAALLMACGKKTEGAPLQITGAKFAADQ